MPLTPRTLPDVFTARDIARASGTRPTRRRPDRLGRPSEASTASSSRTRTPSRPRAACAPGSRSSSSSTAPAVTATPARCSRARGHAALARASRRRHRRPFTARCWADCCWPRSCHSAPPPPHVVDAARREDAARLPEPAGPRWRWRGRRAAHEEAGDPGQARGHVRAQEPDPGASADPRGAGADDRGTASGCRRLPSPFRPSRRRSPRRATTPRTSRSARAEAPAPPSRGPGEGGGAGTGKGTGLGEGTGSGIGEGEGGGEGGGPFRPGSGIQPPRLLSEVKPDYTEDARRRGPRGRSGARDRRPPRRPRRRGAGAEGPRRGGLDQQAIQAVRRWTFAAATRKGRPVDVIVEVAVEFTLR